MEDEGDDEEEKEDEVHLSCMKTSMLIQHEGDHSYKSISVIKVKKFSCHTLHALLAQCPTFLSFHLWRDVYEDETEEKTVNDPECLFCTRDANIKFSI